MQLLVCVSHCYVKDAPQNQNGTLEPGNPATVAVGLQSYIGLYMGIRVEI
jgi:hypothetical protein